MMPTISPAPASARGRSTLLPWFVSWVLVTMKMMRSTRKMSVSGVTLISATIAPSSAASTSVRPSDTDRLLARGPLAEGHQQIIRPFAPDARQVADAHHEGVVREDGEHADDEAAGGGDQRLRDAGRDHREAAGSRRRHAVEGA